jgi:hypothetical protein
MCVPLRLYRCALRNCWSAQVHIGVTAWARLLIAVGSLLFARVQKN